ncbi:PqqD family protein [Sphingomonas sp. G-3-2-10]|uniref:PqqD family protein n=1 Tax=Sphingomonas sp. G-3-2-10 TaxID=2728838 RepID=UPI00146C3A99|nr:PqqD family protein [Sphingomonas sp. G-3-2-10]NML04897.1 PqqD family protein [Sphingomonas sp. G-3-2-10]
MPQALHSDDLIARRPDVVGADTADEALLMDIESSYFYQLNGPASRIWTLVEQPITFEALCDAIRKQFAVSPDQCRADVAEFVTDMQGRGLINVTRA